jgi:serine/threonine-protein kinase
LRPTDSRVIAGRYHLLERLGHGSTATTYLAEDRVLGRRVAVKVFRPEFLIDPRDQARFEREARAAAAVSHPNVVQVFDVGQEGETRFLVMEWVDGTDLKHLIRQRAPLPAEEATRLVLDLLRGLAAIHRAGIVHRDVKPQNVLIDRLGRTKLTDFGIARTARDAGSTETGSVIGTAAYMAPEQATGQPVSPATDLYAAGVILYELLTGRLPFAGDNPIDVLYRHVHDTPTPPRRVNPAIPPALEAVVLRALAKNPGGRFHSSEAMAAALEAALASPQPLPKGAAIAPPLGPRASGGSATRRAHRVARFGVWSAVAVAGGMTMLVLILAVALTLASAAGSAPVSTRAPERPPTVPVDVLEPSPFPTFAPEPAATSRPEPTPEPAVISTPEPTSTPLPAPSPTATAERRPPVELVLPLEVERFLQELDPALERYDVGPSDLEGAYVPEREGIRGLPRAVRGAALLLAAPSEFQIGTVMVEGVDSRGPLLIEIEGQSRRGASLQLLVNGARVWEGDAPFSDRQWERVVFWLTDIPRSPDRTLTVALRNASPHGEVAGEPWIAVRALALYLAAD